MNIEIRSLVDFLPYSTEKECVVGLINCGEIDRESIINNFASPVFVDALVGILITEGSGRISVNYNWFSLEKGDIILLCSSHLHYFSQTSADFKARGLFVSRKFMSNTDSTDMIYKRIRYGTLLFSSPVVHLGEEESKILEKDFLRIENAIKDSEHLYYIEVVINRLSAFYLNLSNIIDRKIDVSGDVSTNRQDNMVRKFIELLSVNYRAEHNVAFYASSLNVSTHHLTLVLKKVTGQSVSDFVCEMLYSDARNLLLHSRLSIQEIALLLNFSDQSAFGKFFKRFSDLSPAEFRKLKN